MPILLPPPWRLLAAALTGLISAGHAAPLTFQAALTAAEHNAPQLKAQNAALAAAEALTVPAGALPDPKLVVGVDNLPVSGSDRWRLNRDFMTMQKVGVMQDVPNADKRQARIALAQAAVAKTEAERRIALLAIRRETAQAWIARYYLERKLALFDELAHENQLLATVVQAQLAGGRGMPADAVMPRQEAAMLAERRDELERDLSTAKSALSRWVGGDEWMLSGEPPNYAAAFEHVQHRLARHPDLVLFEPMTAQAQAQLREAEANKKPDWGVELTYQRRAPQYGDMVSLQFTLDLPIFQSTRQAPQSDAKRAELMRIDAEREAMLREHAQTLASDLAEATRLTRAAARQQATMLPLAQEKLDLQTASYRAGRADLISVLTARRELIEARLRSIDLASQRALLASRLHFTYGDEE